VPWAGLDGLKLTIHNPSPYFSKSIWVSVWHGVQNPRIFAQYAPPMIEQFAWQQSMSRTQSRLPCSTLNRPKSDFLYCPHREMMMQECGVPILQGLERICCVLFFHCISFLASCFTLRTFLRIQSGSPKSSVPFARRYQSLSRLAACRSCAGTLPYSIAYCDNDASCATAYRIQ